MNTILTDDEIDALPLSASTVKDGRADARLVEAAVLAKLREQEPVAEVVAFLSTDRSGRKYLCFAPKDDEVSQPLYAAPLPAVVQVPPGYKLVPVEATEAMCNPGNANDAVAKMAAKCRQEVWADMLAAAPEAPAQGEDYIGGLEYRGNSVAYIHQKLTAYRTLIDEAWQAMRDAGRGPDGKTSLPDAIRVALAAPEAPAQGSYKPCPQCGANTASPNPANWCACPKQPAQPSVPAPWREAVKVAREALESSEAFLLSAGFQSSDAYAKTCAALAQLDALEGEE